MVGGSDKRTVLRSDGDMYIGRVVSSCEMSDWACDAAREFRWALEGLGGIGAEEESMRLPRSKDGGCAEEDEIGGSAGGGEASVIWISEAIFQ